MRHKFNAVKVERDGHTFASKAEGRYYDLLKDRQAAGEIIGFLMQVPIHFDGGGKYVADFLEFRADGSAWFVDVKGFETPKFKADMKRIERLMPWVDLEIVDAKSV